MKKKTPTRNTTAPKTLTASAEKIAAAVAPSLATAVAPAAKPVVATVAAPAAVAAPAKVIAPAKVVAAFPTEQIERLRDASVEVAVEATEILARSGDAKAVAPLAGVLANVDGYCHVVTRAAAAIALGKLDTAESISALLAASKDEMAEVSREACLALGELKAASAVPTLIEIAENTSGFYVTVVRHAAVRSLGKLKAKAASGVLTTISKNEFEETSLSSAAREALSQM